MSRIKTNERKVNITLCNPQGKLVKNFAKIIDYQLVTKYIKYSKMMPRLPKRINTRLKRAFIHLKRLKRRSA
jgi:DNA replicative helicase MCM subunit Mcm2 (Cdc46/Mcm family)